jgi:hypothetical protein
MLTTMDVVYGEHNVVVAVVVVLDHDDDDSVVHCRMSLIQHGSDDVLGRMVEKHFLGKCRIVVIIRKQPM